MLADTAARGQCVDSIGYCVDSRSADSDCNYSTVQPKRVTLPLVTSSVDWLSVGFRSCGTRCCLMWFTCRWVCPAYPSLHVAMRWMRWRRIVAHDSLAAQHTATGSHCLSKTLLQTADVDDYIAAALPCWQCFFQEGCRGCTVRPHWLAARTPRQALRLPRHYSPPFWIRETCCRASRKVTARCNRCNALCFDS